MTISESFQELLRRIQPTQNEMQAAEQHLGTIRTRLAAAFDLKKFFKAGSYSRDTFIRGSSDVDVFAVVSRENVRWGGEYNSSSTILDNFRKDLEGRFWNTRVYRDVQSVVVEFNDCKVDVVPAYFKGMTKENWPLYSIADGRGDWMDASPELHNAFIREQDIAAGGKIRGAARLLKFWRECRKPRIPLSSFHIEMILAADGICKGVKSYADCVAEILQTVARRECGALRDPLGISGYIPAVKTANQRDIALASIRSSREHAASAIYAEKCGDVNEARRQWDIVFNGGFPW